MNKQLSLSALTDELAQAKTRKREFLEQMGAIIPWNEWIEIIQPYYYKEEIGNKPSHLKPCCGYICFKIYTTCRT